MLLSCLSTKPPFFVFSGPPLLGTVTVSARRSLQNSRFPTLAFLPAFRPRRALKGHGFLQKRNISSVVEKWTAIFVPFCTLSQDGDGNAFCFMRLMRCQVRHPDHHLHFLVTSQVFQRIISCGSLHTHPFLRIPNINLCALRNKYLGVCVCVRRNLENVAITMRRKLLHISRMTPSFSKSLFKLLRAEYHNSSHYAIHGMSMSQLGAPRCFIILRKL